jgi:hypothetical protein
MPSSEMLRRASLVRRDTRRNIPEDSILDYQRIPPTTLEDDGAEMQVM